MTPEHVTDLLARGLETAGAVLLPLLVAAASVGLIVGVLQAVTQVQESTLNFAPKLAAIGFTLLIMGPWAIERLVRFAESVIHQLPSLGPGVVGP